MEIYWLRNTRSKGYFKLPRRNAYPSIIYPTLQSCAIQKQANIITAAVFSRHFAATPPFSIIKHHHSHFCFSF